MLLVAGVLLCVRRSAASVRLEVPEVFRNSGPVALLTDALSRRDPDALVVAPPRRCEFCWPLREEAWLWEGSPPVTTEADCSWFELWL